MNECPPSKRAPRRARREEVSDQFGNLAWLSAKNSHTEFLNRIDETILFKPLTLEETITTIVDLLPADLNKRLADKRVTVVLDKKAKEWAAEKGYDPVVGARPLKRFLQRHIETQLARALVGGKVGEGSEATFSVKDDALVMK